MLRDLDIFPRFVSKFQVVSAFSNAKTYQPLTRQYLGDAANIDLNSRLDFFEFLDAMKYLQIALRSIDNLDYDDRHERAALFLQKICRGILIRAAVRRMKREKSIKCGASRLSLNAEQICVIIRLQALLRSNRERARLRQRLIQKQALAQKEIIASAQGQEAAGVTQHKKAASKKGEKAVDKDAGIEALRSKSPTRSKHFVQPVRGRKRGDGIMATVQTRLRKVFGSVQDAFIFFDPEGRDHLTHQEFLVGIKKLSLEVDDDSSKCAAVIAGADKCIDCLEFIRAFAWHDIANWQDAMNEARMLKSSSIAIANDRIKALASGPAPSSTSRAEAAPNQVRAWTSAEMGF